MTLRKYNSNLIQSFWNGMQAGQERIVKSSPFVIEFCQGLMGGQIIRFKFKGSIALAAESSDGFDIEISHKKDDTILEVVRNQSDDDSMFIVLSTDLVALSTLCTEFTQEECARAVVDRITAWQKFMKTAGRRLSDEKELGLFGELLILNQWLAHGGRPQQVNEVWSGPIRLSNDFVFKNGYGFEVKTSLNDAPLKVRIDNIGQLDTEKTPHLALVAVKVTEAIGGETLVTLVDQINERLILKSARLAFMSKLISTGFNPENPTRELRPFKVDFVRAFDATSVPRITPGSVPGVLAAQYDILLLGEDGQRVFESKELDFTELLDRVIKQEG